MHDGAEPHTTQDIPASPSSAIQSSQQKGVERLLVSNLPLRRKKMKSGVGNSSGKNVVIKHGDDVDDHHTYTWGSESDCENYELHNYKTILMLTEKFQMKYDVFGRLLEI